VKKRIFSYNFFIEGKGKFFPYKVVKYRLVLATYLTKQLLGTRTKIVNFYQISKKSHNFVTASEKNWQNCKAEKDFSSYPCIFFSIKGEKNVFMILLKDLTMQR